MKITQRNKNSDLTITHEFRIPNESLKFKISGSPDSWNTLYAISSSDPEYVGNLIWLHFAKPASDYINSYCLRGIHRGREEFIFKRFCTLLVSLLFRNAHGYYFPGIDVLASQYDYKIIGTWYRHTCHLVVL